MKVKILLTVILLSSLFTTNAQMSIPKRSILLGGDLSFGSYKDDEGNNRQSKSRGFSISPSVAVAIRENLFIGLSLGYSYYKNTATFPSLAYDSSIRRVYQAGVFARKYRPLKNNFYLFLQGGLGGSYSNRSIEDMPGREHYQKDIAVNLSVAPGISYAINSKLQIEAGFNNILGISYSRTEYMDNVFFPDKETQTNFSAYTTLNNFNSQLYFGFRLLLQKKNSSKVATKAS